VIGLDTNTNRVSVLPSKNDDMEALRLPLVIGIISGRIN
jgi:hypothetical protein